MACCRQLTPPLAGRETWADKTRTKSDNGRRVREAADRVDERGWTRRNAMKAWVRCGHGTLWLPAAVLLVVLALAAYRGQSLGGQQPECDIPPPGQAAMPSSNEPPMVDAPDATRPPFVPPSPTPLPAEQANPFGMGLPFNFAPPAAPAEPLVRLRVQAPARSEPDKEIEYRLSVENVSRAAAHHVVVRDRLPRGMEEHYRAEPKPSGTAKAKNGATDLLWDLGTLKAGDSKDIVLAIKPSGGDEVRNSAYVQFEHGQTVTTQIAKPGLRLKTTAPAQAIRYDAVPFRLEVSNTGTAPLRDVVVTDELPAGLEFVGGKPEPSGEKPLTWKVSEVPPGQTRRIDYEAIAKNTGKFNNKAKATAAGGVSAADSASVNVAEAKLSISTSGPVRRILARW